MRLAERLFSLHAAEKAEQGRQGEKHMSWFDHRPRPQRSWEIIASAALRKRATVSVDADDPA